MKEFPPYWRREVIAAADIPDSPLAEEDAGARKGERGEIQDTDPQAGHLFVDFGRGALLCDLDELRLAPVRKPRKAPGGPR